MYGVYAELIEMTRQSITFALGSAAGYIFIYRKSDNYWIISTYVFAYLRIYLIEKSDSIGKASTLFISSLIDKA